MKLPLPAACAASVLAAAFLPAPAMAYGAYGHHVVAEIAMANVSSRTARAVKALLRRSAVLGTAACPARTIEQASVWADCARSLGPDFAYSAPWHYQNVDVCAPFDLAPACKDGNCVSAQIGRQAARLKDKKLSLHDRVEALVFLVHFTGDLHMPLHSGDHHDRGGNQLKAAWGSYAPAWLNLHGIWDGVLAERALTTGPTLVHRYTQREAAPIAAGTIADWSQEAWQLSRDITYPSALGSQVCSAPAPARITLDDATITRLVPVARLQVERAGLRLARLLDEALG